VQTAAKGAVCTPPWPLQAPLPVAVEVVPSLHVVGAESACASVIANIITGAARTPDSKVFFTKRSPLFDRSMQSKDRL
jgi:hypothetical protein